MNIKFKLPYHTTYGDELLLNIAPSPEDDNLALDMSQFKVLAMTTHDGATWTLDTTLDSKDASRYDYFYSVRGIRGIKCSEWKTVMHRLDLTAAKANTYEVNDRWTDFPGDTYMYSSAFTDCVNRRAQIPAQSTNYATTLRLVVRAPQLRSGMRLHLVGAQAALGNWDLSKSLPMTEHNHNEWYVDIDASLLFATSKRGSKKAYDDSSEIEFKFVAIGDKNEIEWETCNNRILAVEPLKQGELRSIALDQAFFALYDEKVAGTLIPVFSLRSEGSFGVGDFGDLKLMIDWVAKTHQRLLQVLPINDSTSTHTWTDSYPYSCISVFALHPQYCDLRQLPAIDDKVEADRFEMLREELNALPQIDYERVNNVKIKYLQMLFKQEGKKVLESEDFKSFFKATNHWLVPYAQYCYLRDKYGTCEFAKWKDHNLWDEADRDALSNPKNKAFKEVAFFYYVQYVLDRQMRSAHDYARARGVILKGDIPIGVNRNGCDVWHEPEYFHLDSQAGAPPDAFSVNGQNWGFPTYNWERMIADGCQWWVRRFQNMQQYFDAYRIDHVLGFFRIWAIPTDCVHGLLGQFQPALAMSRDEIQGYGLNFQEELFTKPFIADWVIDRVFKEHAEEVKEKYLQHDHDNIFSLKPEYDTERKIEAAFEGKTTDKDIWLRDGLYAMVEDVLFVRDRQNPNMFHPRITAQLNFMYEALWQNDKDAFNRLYNDYFYRRNNDFWYREAMKKLPLLSQATRMLVCAEDLGMVPDCVQWVMNELRILSLELQSMPKDPSVEFGHLSRNPYRSVCTLSTHDMPTLRQWWDEDYDRTQKYYNSMLYRGGAAPHPLPGWLARDIVSRQLTSPSMLCILSLQDWFAIDERIRLADANAERINIPANPKHYWRYRMHMTIEQLLADRDYNDQVKELVDEAGRK
uniref:4-alpha-glucanotransferase n=1 Tax=Prevotella sp. TaxID=59823 RepID=UPI0040264DC0